MLNFIIDNFWLIFFINILIGFYINICLDLLEANHRNCNSFVEFIKNYNLSFKNLVFLIILSIFWLACIFILINNLKENQETYD